jgi:hypothetical protein
VEQTAAVKDKRVKEKEEKRKKESGKKGVLCRF